MAIDNIFGENSGASAVSEAMLGETVFDALQKILKIREEFEDDLAEIGSLQDAINLADEDRIAADASRVLAETAAELAGNLGNARLVSAVADLPAADGTQGWAIILAGSEEGIYEDTGSWTRRFDTQAAIAQLHANRLTVLAKAPGSSSALFNLVDLRLRLRSANGDKINWPDNISVREFATDSLNRFRFRLGGGSSLGADGNYPQIGAEHPNASAAESVVGGLFIGYDAFSASTELELYASDTSLGVPKGTVIGTYRVAFHNAPFGTYYPFAVFPIGDSEIVKSKVLLGSTETSNLLSLVNEAIAESDDINSPFVASYSSGYGKRLIKDIRIEGGVPGRDYVLNIRTDRGSGSQFRLILDLYDTVRGTRVASGGRVSSTDFSGDLDTFYISGASLGSKNATLDYVGLNATVFFNDLANNVDWDFGATNFTTTDHAVKHDRILSPEDMKTVILEAKAVQKTIKTFGPGGDFATLTEAINSLLDYNTATAADDIQRAWWPFSHSCTPTSQVELVAMPGHTETKTPVIPSGVSFARGWLLWMGLTIRLLPDTRLLAENAGTTTTYAFDMNLGGRLIIPPGAQVESVSGNSAAAIHQDQGGSLTTTADASASDPLAGRSRFHIYGLISGGGNIKSPIQPYNAGIADQEFFRFEDITFETTGTGPNFQSHTSRNNERSGRYEFINVTLKGGTKTINLTNAGDGAGTFAALARHEILVANSDVDIVTGASMPAGTTPTSTVNPFVRIGKQAGITYSGSVEP